MLEREFNYFILRNKGDHQANYFRLQLQSFEVKEKYIIPLNFNVVHPLWKTNKIQLTNTMKCVNISVVMSEESTKFGIQFLLRTY